MRRTLLHAKHDPTEKLPNALSLGVVRRTSERRFTNVVSILPHA